MGIILQYRDITKDNVLKALRTVLDTPRCNTQTLLCTYSVILYYSKVTTAINTEIKNVIKINMSTKLVNHPNIIIERTLET